MTQSIPQFASRQHHPATTAALVLLFWLIAAVLVAGAHLAIEPRSAGAGATATIVTLMVVAFCYTRLVAREASVAHALGVGIAWLVLSIVAEMAVASRAGHGWFYLLGSPDRPLLRNICLFVWVFAPALFARRESA